MAVARHGGDAGKYFAALEQPRPALVGRDLFAAGLKKSFADRSSALAISPSSNQCASSFSCITSSAFGNSSCPFDMSVRPAEWSGCMWVSKTVSIDFGSIAGCDEVALNEAGRRLHVVARSGVDDRGASLRVDQEGVDAGPPRRPERVGQDLPRLVEIDVAHHVEGAVEIAVADGGDDDVADLAVIDAGNLRCRLCVHTGETSRLEGPVRRRLISEILRWCRRADRGSAPTCSARCGFRRSGRREWFWPRLPPAPAAARGRGCRR